ncbi:kinase-like domain-containing protein [Pisolithus sp. B1]|nr:kinase-like domain-containing protein [Pisolithus sp. B1]
MTTTTIGTPLKVPPILYTAHLGTRWQKEKAAAGLGAFDFPEDPVYVGQWIVGECVGSGASSRVRIAKHCQTGQLAAVKIIPILPLDTHPGLKSEKQRLNIDREIVVMKLMNHPNILRIYDVFQGENELYLVLEYVQGGELFDFLVNRGRLPPLEALAIFKQIVYGLNYAHSLSIVHRDLKPENILIHSLNPPLIKIADWGMAAFAPPLVYLETSCGSPHYASPEIINGFKYAGGATDIWSCGVILFALLTGRLPFDDKDVRKLLAKVRGGKYELPAYVDPLAKDLLTRMLVVDVRRRITIPQIMAHPWFNRSTPGILYVPVPLVHDLAQLLTSEAHIDEDLLESLRVLLGRYGNDQVIKAELLRPRGQGILAKAIYVLLQKRHEQMVRDHGTMLSVEESKPSMQGKVVTKHYWSPSLTKRNQVNVRAQHLELHRLTSHDAHSSRLQTPPPSPSFEAPPVLESPAHCQPPSPSRLRRRCHFSSSMLALQPTRRKSLRAGRAPGDPSAVLTRVPHQTCSVSSHSNHIEQDCFDRNQQISRTMCGIEISPPSSSAQRPLSQYVQRDSSSSVTRTCAVTLTSFEVNNKVLMPPSPFGTPHNCPTLVCLNDGHESQCAIFPKEDTHTSIDSPLQLPARTPHGPVPTANDRWAREDKENIVYGGGTGQSQLSAESFAQSTGETAFRARDRDSKYVAKKVTSMSGEPAPKLDLLFYPSQPDSTTDSSPTALRQAKTVFCPHTGSPGTSSNLSSPVGEVRSWLSHLFNRKPHTYVLYSTASFRATCNETIRALERLGVAVGPQESSPRRQDSGITNIMRCRMNDGVKCSGSGVVQKYIQFRVEFSLSPNALQMSNESLSSSPRPLNDISSEVGSPSGDALWPQLPALTSSTPPQPRSLATGATARDYPCAVVLVQEKGSVSGFKTMCRRLCELWTLDTSGTSLQSGSSRF